MSKNTKIVLTIAVIVIALWYFGRANSKKEKSSEENGSSNEGTSSGSSGYDFEPFPGGGQNGSGSDTGSSETSGYDFEPFPGGGQNNEDDEDDQDGEDQDDYDEDGEDLGFGESPVQPSFDPDDDPSNLRTENWSDPHFPANFGSGSVISQPADDNNAMQIVNPAPIYNGSIESYNQNMVLKNKQPRRTGSTQTLQNKARRGSGSTGRCRTKFADNI